MTLLSRKTTFKAPSKANALSQMLAVTACVVEGILLGMLAYFGMCARFGPRALMTQREEHFHSRW